MKRELAYLRPFYNTLTPEKHGEIFTESAKAYGFRSVNQVAKAAKVGPTVLGNLISGKKPLITDRGYICEEASRVGIVLGETPERLFPKAFQYQYVSDDNINKYYRDLTAFNSSERKIIRGVINTLDYRSRMVIFTHFFERKDYFIEEYIIRRKVRSMKVHINSYQLRRALKMLTKEPETMKFLRKIWKGYEK